MMLIVRAISSIVQGERQRGAPQLPVGRILAREAAVPADVFQAPAVIPAALPSFINTALFSLEKSTRSSVVLGLVGAGGIGIELKVAMDLFEYPTAATIILCIFALVLAVERVSSSLRQRIL